MVYLSAQNDSEVMIDERFKVHPGQTLSVNVEHADVTVTTGDVDEAHIVITLDSDDLSDARELFEQMDFTVEMVGDEVRVESKSRDNNWNFNSDRNFDLNVDVTIPEEFNAQMTTTHGDVELGDIVGRVLLNTTHGDVSVGSIEGSEISLRSTHGDIDGESLLSEKVTLNTTHADIEIELVRSRFFSATTTHSDVRVDLLEGKSNISTSHGDIEVSMIDGYAAELTTSHGDVMLYAPTGLTADLDLKGAQVKLGSVFRLEGQAETDHVSGRINGGGAKILARTTHGSIYLRNK